MASFLKNTGDIILDAVLTDEGRRRLAMGDGSFKITKFALGDDEIDYSLWDNQANSGFEDVAIKYTPIFEAYTNNASSLKNKLMSIDSQNILFMPVIRMNTLINGIRFYGSYNAVLVPVLANTETLLFSSTDQDTLLTSLGQKKISLHQGIDSNIYSDKTKTMELEGYGNLVETEYNVFLDDRLLYVPEASSGPLTVDDDYIATYSFSLNDGAVTNLPTYSNGTDNSPIQGSRGTQINFKVLPQPSLVTSGLNLFNKLGSTISNLDNNNNSYYVIRTVVKVVGVSTGYSVEIPVMLAKYKSNP